MLGWRRNTPFLRECRHEERTGVKQLDRFTAGVACRSASAGGGLGRSYLLPRLVFFHMEEVRCASGTLQLEFEASGCLLLSTEARVSRKYIFSLQSYTQPILLACCQADHEQHRTDFKSQVKKYELSNSMYFKVI